MKGEDDENHPVTKTLSKKRAKNGVSLVEILHLKI